MSASKTLIETCLSSKLDQATSTFTAGNFIRLVLKIASQLPPDFEGIVSETLT